MATIFGDVQYSQVMGHLPTPDFYHGIFVAPFFGRGLLLIFPKKPLGNEVNNWVKHNDFYE